MAKEKVKQKEKPDNSEVEKPLDENLRFQYIGFDVYGKKAKDLFKTEAEKKHYEQSVAQYEKEHYSPFRGMTAVKRDLLTGTDRIVLTISSLVLIISAFLPWLSFETNWVSLKFNGLLGYFQASQYFDIINMFNPKLMLFVYVPVLFSLLALLFGVVTLIMLYMPTKNKETLLARLKRVMGLQWFVLAGWLAFFVVAIIGVQLPFGDWMAENYGLKGVGDSVTVVSFATLSGIGVWMSIAALVMNAVKSNDF